RRGRWRRTEIDRPSDTPGGLEPTQRRRLLAVDLHRKRGRPVYVFLDDRNPVVRQIASELELYARVVDWDGGGQDQRIPITFFPEAVDYGRHKAQHAARALKLDQCG